MRARRPFSSRALLLCAALLPAWTARAEMPPRLPLKLATVTMREYPRGEVAMPCLRVDGALVRVSPPTNAESGVSGDTLSVHWRAGNGRTEIVASAVFRSATLPEAGLLSTPPATAEQWNRVAAASLPPGAVAGVAGTVEENVLPVNGWQAAAVTLGYRMGNLEFSHYLLVCRCVDGTVFALTLESDVAGFETRRTALVRTLGMVPVRIP